MHKKNYIIIADDDLDDQLLVKKAFKKNNFDIPLTFVDNGEELISFFIDNPSIDLPSFILLDLNMPKKNGKDCIIELKQSARLKNIPIVMFSTSSQIEDIEHTYDLGASSYIHKPTDFEDLKKIVNTLGDYWFKTVLLPANAS